MSDAKDRSSGSGPRTVLDKIKAYSHKADAWRHRARKVVFGANVQIDRWTLPVKLLQRHRVLQRRQAFHQSGGTHSSIVQYALEKARHGRK